MNTPLTIALTKGRIMEEAVAAFEKAGILLSDANGRRLACDSKCGKYRFFIIRGRDATTYVQLGAADVGVVGKDVLMEYGNDNLYELLDLGIARCRLVTARPKGAPTPARTLRVAAKYVNCAKRFYAQKGRQAQIVPLYGSLELAPNAGLADEIVDIADTGNTLKNNGLVEESRIADISARLIANKAAMRLRHGEIAALRALLEKSIDKK